MNYLFVFFFFLNDDDVVSGRADQRPPSSFSLSGKKIQTIKKNNNPGSVSFFNLNFFVLP